MLKHSIYNSTDNVINVVMQMLKHSIYNTTDNTMQESG